jgi:lysophospholipase L1-like esterase
MTAAVSESKPRRRVSLWAKFGLLLGSIVFAIVVGEIALRLLGIPAEELTFLPKDGSVDWDCYCTNYRGYFVPKKLPNGQTIYCVDHENEPPRVKSLAEAQKRGAFTVLAIGDSFTYGLGVKVIDAWPAKLLGPLSRKGKEAVVSNVGKVGRHVMEVMTEQYQPHSDPPPDVVIYGFCLNDVLWIPQSGADRPNPVSPMKKDATMETGDIDDFINVRTANLKQLRIESTFGGIRQKLRTVDVVLRTMEAREIQRRTLQFYLDLYDPAKNAKGLEVTWNAVQQMSDRQNAAGKRFVVAVFPMFVDTDGDYPLKSCHDAITESLTQRGVQVLDLLPIYRKTPAKDLWVHPLDRHPNDVAHRMAAEAIGKHL